LQLIPQEVELSQHLTLMRLMPLKTLFQLNLKNSTKQKVESFAHNHRQQALLLYLLIKIEKFCAFVMEE